MAARYYYKSFAVVGAAILGGYIIDNLLKAKASGQVSRVVVVSRSDIKDRHPKWVAEGAEFAIINYDSPETIRAAFSGIDVVISTITTQNVLQQNELAFAAKESNVRLFIPSEFGDPSDNPTQGFWIVKREVQKKLEEIKLPYVLIYTGIWPDYVFFDPTWGFDIINNKFEIRGGGDTPMSFTGRPDVATFTVHVLTTLPASELEWRTFRIEGEKSTWNEIAVNYQKSTGKELEIKRVPKSTLIKNVESDPNDLPSQIAIVWDEGEGLVGKTDNHVWPEWKPKKIFEIVTELMEN